MDGIKKILKAAVDEVTDAMIEIARAKAQEVGEKLDTVVVEAKTTAERQTKKNNRPTGD
jgi:hypothetical protein